LKEDTWDWLVGRLLAAYEVWLLRMLLAMVAVVCLQV
jgi:hypothetical protein